MDSFKPRFLLPTLATLSLIATCKGKELPDGGVLESAVLFRGMAKTGTRRKNIGCGSPSKDAFRARSWARRAEGMGNHAGG